VAIIHAIEKQNKTRYGLDIARRKILLSPAHASASCFATKATPAASFYIFMRGGDYYKANLMHEWQHFRPHTKIVRFCLLVAFAASSTACDGLPGSSNNASEETPIATIPGASNGMPTIPDPNTIPDTPAGVGSDSIIDIPFDVKDTSGLGASDFPIHAVVPLLQGQLHTTEGLMVTDSQGSVKPAQFSVHNRWWARDNSIRHLLVQMPATVNPYTSAGTGIARYKIVTGDNTAPANPVQVSDGDDIIINNGLIQIALSRSPFTITTPAGELDAQFNDQQGKRAPTFARDDIELSIEEVGPVRAIIRASAPTITRSDGSLLHGWAMRLYAYAGQSHIKIDFQLQNAALDSVLSGPLYFDSFELLLTGAATATQSSRRAVLNETALTEELAGALTSTAAGIGIRQFYETWPNGVSSKSDGTLVAELFPAWSENQELPNDGIYTEGLTSNNSGLYWLEDMQAVVKEVIIDFSSPSQTDMLDYYRKTAATLDLSGYLSSKLVRPTDDDNTRTPNYPLQSTNFWMPTLNDVFFLGWDEFLQTAVRKRAPNTAGSYPSQNAQFIVSGNPRDYFIAADRARGELNVTPQWLPGYQYDVDQTRLQLTENPYGSSSWRKIAQGDTAHLRFSYLPGTRQDAKPRDDQHGWFYHVAQSYDFTADPWVRDWYEFVAEFRKVRLLQADPFPDMSGRGTAHALDHALQAYRITGDTQLLAMLTNYVTEEIEPRLNANDAWTGERGTIIASWATGYLLRTMIGILDELPGEAPLTRHSPTANVVIRSINWNMAIGNFSDWRDLSELDLGISDGNGFTLIDPQLWYAKQVNSNEALDHVVDFIDGGANGGTTPYGNFGGWNGSYEGRFTPIAVEDFR